MNVSFLLPHLELYGGTRRVLELSNHLIDRGHHVTIFHSDGSACDWMEVYASVESLKECLEQEHDIFIYTFQTLYPRAKKVRARKKHYYNLNLFNKQLLRLPLFLLRLARRFSYQVNVAYEIRRALLDETFSLLANCTDSKEWINDYINREADVVFGGVGSDVFHPVPGAKSKEGTTVLYTGSWKSWKDTETIEKALAIVKQQVPNLKTDTYYGKNLPQTAMAEVYSAACIFVDAQYYAGWNNPVAEAMACKTPVVCTDIGPNKDIATHEETALVVSVGDAQAMADAVVRLITDKDLRERLVQNAYEKISQFTWERATDQLETILKNHA